MQASQFCRWNLRPQRRFFAGISILQIAPYSGLSHTTTHRPAARPFTCVPAKPFLSKEKYARGETTARDASAMAIPEEKLAVVYVTVPADSDVGKKLARLVVEARLAACVNIVPGLQSIYVWEGKVAEDAEALLIMKTRETLVAELSDFVRENHPYDECEVISLPVQGGSPTYLNWVLQSTRSH